MTFNHHLIRHALNDTGMLVSELAYRSDMSINTLTRLLDGEEDPGDLRVATLTRLADHLGLPLQALIAAPDQPDPDPGQQPPGGETAEDFATVISAIYDRGNTPTLNSELCDALDWNLDRLTTAYKEADRRLRPAGLRLNRSHGEASIVPLHNHAATRQSLNEVSTSNKGLTIEHYQAIYALMQGRPWTDVSGSNTTRRRFITGALINHGILTGEREDPHIADAVTFGDPHA
ncbi:helix-turn-helix transcriptional regulator [Nocardioides panacis]|uniref:Helix-turn-helix transcriptional regulator n=1 Tax=Nocardioides panacis TaxID=2849501 RepID=A0A975SXF8_9ACTN|nr:helix-turn-helix transcriptional regulator [Nocardioides panacis]QWZ07712.1 helix-turn-helix transcriptional regulator [Nocardioides panacis]